jgi:molybdopterin-dependent oxidoreductase alpha subunit
MKNKIGLKNFKNAPSSAVGWKSIKTSLLHISKSMPLGRGVKVLSKLNQKKGIDCPSCAWPDPDGHRSSIGEFCENGVKAIADEATTRKVGPAFFQRYSINEMLAKSDYWLGQQGRLTSPMYIDSTNTHYQPITWDKAFEIIAQELNSLENPNESVFYTSGRSSNEAAFLYQLFVRAYGTNNLPDCSNMCHESSGVALQETLGIGKGSVKLEDFEKSEVIIIMGQNPGTNHPRMLSTLEKAKKNGAVIIAVNPLKEPGLINFKNPQSIAGLMGQGTQIADHYLQIKINSDQALLQYLNINLLKNHLLFGDVLDEDFIKTRTEGFGNYQSFLSTISAFELLEKTGLDYCELEKVINILSHKSKIIICWAMGLTQHKNAVATIKELVNLLLLKGAVGKEGSGTCPVRGHSNVQGDRTVGIMHKPSEALNEAIEKRYGFTPPQNSGFDVVESIEAMYQKKAKVFFALGGNFLSAAPDTNYTTKALQNCNLTVHVSTKLNRSHLIHGKKALILPCLGRTDVDSKNGKIQCVSTENSMGVVQTSQGNLKPVSENLMSEPAIIAKLAQKTLQNKYNIPWKDYENDYDKIRMDISDTILGFENYNEKLQNKGGFYLPNPPREGIFNSKNNKAQFSLNPFIEVKLKKDELLMMTIRSHDQFNTTIYGLNDRYRGIFNERNVVFINSSDIVSLGFEEFEKVDVVSNYDGVERKIENFTLVPYDIPQKCVAAYFPETNVLVPLKQVADYSQTPTSKSIIVTLKKISPNH